MASLFSPGMPVVVEDESHARPKLTCVALD